MKLKNNLLLRQVADTWVVLPVAEATLDFNGMMTMNETGALIWKELEKGAGMDALINAMTQEYSVSREQALADIEEFLDKLQRVGCLEEGI